MTPKRIYHARAVCTDGVQRLGSDYARIVTGTEGQAGYRFQEWLENCGPIYGFDAVHVEVFALNSAYGAPIQSYTVYR